MEIPKVDLTLPISYTEYIDGHQEMKLFVNGKCFWGVIKDYNLNKADEIGLDMIGGIRNAGL